MPLLLPEVTLRKVSISDKSFRWNQLQVYAQRLVGAHKKLQQADTEPFQVNWNMKPFQALHHKYFMKFDKPIHPGGSIHPWGARQWKWCSEVSFHALLSLVLSLLLFFHFHLCSFFSFLGVWQWNWCIHISFHFHFYFVPSHFLWGAQQWKWCSQVSFHVSTQRSQVLLDRPEIEYHGIRTTNQW